MKQDNPVYPDISDILALKEEGRREIKGRTFGEKIAMVERMRERLAPLKRRRERRTAVGAPPAAAPANPSLPGEGEDSPNQQN